MSGEMMPHTIEGQVFLGSMTETENARKVEWVANNMVNVLHFRPDSDQDRSRVSDYSSRMINSLGFKADSVENLKLVEDDSSKTPEQKRIAKENLEVLAKGTFLAMQRGMDIEMMDLLGQGSAVEIDNILPTPLKGLGERVVKNIISSEPIRIILRDLDDVRENCDLDNPKDRELMLKEISQAYADLTRIRGLNPDEKEQLKMVKAYLNAKMQTLESNTEMDQKKSEEGENRTEIPPDKEGQLIMVREILNALELSGNQTREYAISQTVAYMEKIANILHPEVALEVRSRLKLIDCYVFMKMADGRIDPPKVGGEEVPTIGIAAARARGQNHALDRDSIKFFLETKDGRNANGLPIAKAWDLLQEANFNYGKLLIKVVEGMSQMSEDEKRRFLSIEDGTILDDDATLGRVDTNYFTDPEVNRRAEVRKYMVKALGDSSEAKKAVELADKLALATAETSIFNKALTGNDQLAEDIYFKKYRTSRKSQGRNRGATIHQEEIDGLGTSWLRRESKVPIDQMMKSDQIHFDNIAEGSYNYFFPVWVSAKIHPLRNHLTDEAPNPKEILAPGYFKNVVDYFNKADPPELIAIRPDGSGAFKEKEITTDKKTGKKSIKEYVEYNGKKYYVEKKSGENGKSEEFVNFGSGPTELKMSKSGRKDLRTWWALGVVQQALAFPELGWDPVQSLLLLEREMVKEKLSEEAGGFLSPEQWKWVVEQKVYWNGKKWLNAKEGALKRARNTRSVEFSNSILSGGLSGKKKR